MSRSWLLILAVFGALFSWAAAAVSLTEGPRVEVHGATAEITWKTDSVSGSRVHYGTAPNQLDQRAGEDVAVDHRVKIEGLRPGVKYFFSVGTAKYVLGQGSFTAGGEGTAEVASPSVVKPTMSERPRTRSEAPTTFDRPKSAPSTREIWGDLASLPDHFHRHGKDFGATSEDDYARKSWEFLQRAIAEGLPAKMDDAEGTLRVWDPKTHTFGAYRRDHKARTFFKPESASYFDRQPGAHVQLKH